VFIREEIISKFEKTPFFWNFWILESINIYKVIVYILIMELPDDILKIIKEYTQPITRPDWREGCYFNRHLDEHLDIHLTLEEVIDIVYVVNIITISQNINYEYIMLYNEFLV